MKMFLIIAVLLISVACQVCARPASGENQWDLNENVWPTTSSSTDAGSASVSLNMGEESMQRKSRAKKDDVMAPIEAQRRVRRRKKAHGKKIGELFSLDERVQSLPEYFKSMTPYQRITERKKLTGVRPSGNRLPGYAHVPSEVLVRAKQARDDNEGLTIPVSVGIEYFHYEQDKKMEPGLAQKFWDKVVVPSLREEDLNAEWFAELNLHQARALDQEERGKAPVAREQRRARTSRGSTSTIQHQQTDQERPHQHTSRGSSRQQKYRPPGKGIQEVASIWNGPSQHYRGSSSNALDSEKKVADFNLNLVANEEE